MNAKNMFLWFCLGYEIEFCIPMENSILLVSQNINKLIPKLHLNIKLINMVNH